MKFKYKTPSHFRGNSVDYAGKTYQVKNGVVESDVDIFNVLHSHGFTRADQEPDQIEKKATSK